MKHCINHSQGLYKTYNIPWKTSLFSEITEVTVKHIMEQVQLYQRHTTHIYIKRCLLSNSGKESH
jgi:hypothetical protein